MDTKEKVRIAVRDIVFELMITSRNLDANCPLGFIDNAIFSGEISLDEMVEHFKSHICYILGVQDESELSKRIKLKQNRG